MAKQPASMNNQKGLSELFARLKFLLMAIIIYRIGTHIPVPGFDPDRLAELFNQNQGTFLGLFNMFSGGALERLSIFSARRNALYFGIDNNAVAFSDCTLPSATKKRGR